MEKEDLSFRLLETPTAIFLYFSDGNVITADDQGLVAYSTTKTIFFKSAETQVHSTFISALDDKVTVWIRPTTKKVDFGLHNDIKLSDSDKIIRNYFIKQKHYDKIKEFLWQQSINKTWPDD
jgi:hypothetical protein